MAWVSLCWVAQTEADIRTQKNIISEVDKLLGTDFGPDKAFYKLKGQCFSTRGGQYEYKV